MSLVQSILCMLYYLINEHMYFTRETGESCEIALHQVTIKFILKHKYY